MISANSRYIRHKYLFILIIFLLWAPIYGADAAELARWERQAKNVSIVRDNWGIAHVTGKTDPTPSLA